MRTPSLGDSVKDVRELLKAQFPPTTKDITDDEMFDVMDDVFASSRRRRQAAAHARRPRRDAAVHRRRQRQGAQPCRTSSRAARRGSRARCFRRHRPERAHRHPDAAEADRPLRRPVALSDNDVETVVRKVVLRKKPEQVADAQDGARRRQRRDRSAPRRHTARAASRGQAGSRARLPVPSESPALLGTCSARDRQAGKAGVLRTQLKIVHEAARSVADRADRERRSAATFVFTSESPGMLQSGVLLKEIDELIRGLERGRRRRGEARSCALIFLISQLDPDDRWRNRTPRLSRVSCRPPRRGPPRRRRQAPKASSRTARRARHRRCRSADRAPAVTRASSSSGTRLRSSAPSSSEVLDQEVGDERSRGAKAGLAADRAARQLADEEDQRTDPRLQTRRRPLGAQAADELVDLLEQDSALQHARRLLVVDEVATDDVADRIAGDIARASWTILSWVRRTPALPARSIARRASSQKRRRVGSRG